MALPPPRLYDPIKDAHLLAQMVKIHGECIEYDEQLLTFLPPVEFSRMMPYWEETAQKVKDDKSFLVIQCSDETEKEVIGFAFLDMPFAETGPFRGIVHKMMVSPHHRGKGVAKRVMDKLESVARERERYLLMLDTPVGWPAEKVYPKLGFIEIGVVPKYGISPKDGSLVDEKFFYKDLRDVKV